jgi:glucose-6-phosphate 1-dehydrogenase
MIEASWAAVDPVLKNPGQAQAYEAGSAGPQAADALLARDNHAWKPMQS